MTSSLRRLDEVQESKYREQDKNEKRRFLPARCGTEIESVRFRLRDIKIYTMKSLILAQDER